MNSSFETRPTVDAASSAAASWVGFEKEVSDEEAELLSAITRAADDVLGSCRGGTSGRAGLLRYAPKFQQLSRQQNEGRRIFSEAAAPPNGSG